MPLETESSALTTSREHDFEGSSKQKWLLSKNSWSGAIFSATSKRESSTVIRPRLYVRTFLLDKSNCLCILKLEAFICSHELRYFARCIFMFCYS